MDFSDIPDPIDVDRVAHFSETSTARAALRTEIMGSATELRTVRRRSSLARWATPLASAAAVAVAVAVGVTVTALGPGQDDGGAAGFGPTTQASTEISGIDASEGVYVQGRPAPLSDPGAGPATPPPDGQVGTNIFGMTYGLDQPYPQLNGERPQLVLVAGTDGVGGYAYIDDLAQIEQGSGAISLFLEDGATVVGELAPPLVAGLPTNSRGQTYGPLTGADTTRSPDLVLVEGIAGVEGYVPRAAFDEPTPPAGVDSYEDFETWRASLPTEVPVTEADGVTAIDTYALSTRVRNPYQ